MGGGDGGVIFLVPSCYTKGINPFDWTQTLLDFTLCGPASYIFQVPTCNTVGPPHNSHLSITAMFSCAADSFIEILLLKTSHLDHLSPTARKIMSIGFNCITFDKKM